MKRFAVAFVVAITGSLALHAQEIRSSTLLTTDHYLDWERVRDAQISPDGSRIVYTREHVNKLEDKWESETWILKSDGSEHRFFVKGSSARWSPDGKRLLYVAEGEPKGSQVFVRWVDAEGPATQITHVLEMPRSVRWSPDGKSIAFSMFEPEQEKWNISMPSEPKGAKWTPPPRIVDTLHYRQDRIGFLEDGYTHLFVVPAEGGTPRALTSGKWSVGAGELRGAATIDWTPDSKSIVFDGNRDGDADLKYQRSQLYVVDVAGGAIRDLVSKPGSWGDPVVSPDGKLVAFTGYEPSGHTHTVSDLFVIPIGGGEMRKISGDYDRNPNNLFWAPDGNGVYFDADDRGSRNIQFAAIAGGVKAVTTGTQVLTFDSVSHDLIAAGTLADPEHPQDIMRVNLRQPAKVARLTDVNSDVLAGKQIAKTADSRDPRRTVLDVQRRVQLDVPEFCRQPVRRALREPARQHRLRQRVRERDRSQLSRSRLRRPDGRRRRSGGQGLHRDVADVRIGVQRRWRPFKLGDRQDGSIRRSRGPLSRDRLDQHGGTHRRAAVHLQLLPEAVLGRSERLALAFVTDERRKGDDADTADDRHSRSPHADAADRGVLRGAQDEGRTDEAAAVQRRVPRHRLQAVELHPDAVVHDELVQQIHAPVRTHHDHDVRTMKTIRIADCGLRTADLRFDWTIDRLGSTYISTTSKIRNPQSAVRNVRCDRECDSSRCD
jgi:Tol biopolymer transport system component